MDSFEARAVAKGAELEATFRDRTKNQMIESGINIEPESFAKFWKEYEFLVFEYAYFCISRPMLRRYEDADKAYGSSNYGAHKGNHRIQEKFIFSLLALLFGLTALLFVLR